MLPNTFIIGAAKSGTTAVAAALASHPEVFVPCNKEPFYFAYPGVKPGWCGPGDRTDFVVEDFDDYCRLFSDASQHSVAVDASTGYLYSATAADNVYAFNKGAKIVAVLRQPAERAYSAFLHVQRRTTEETSDFTKALQLEEQRIAAGYEHLWHYRSMGLYAEQLKRWFARFPRDQIKVFLYDDLIGDPASFYGELFKFLGVDPDVSVDLTAKRNESQIPKSKKLQSLLLSANPLKRGLARMTPEPLRKAVWRRSLHKPGMPPEIRNELTQEFTGEIRLLEQLISRDLSRWLTPL
jgi:hypothetical protein